MTKKGIELRLDKGIDDRTRIDLLVDNWDIALQDHADKAVAVGLPNQGTSVGLRTPRTNKRQ